MEAIDPLPFGALDTVSYVVTDSCQALETLPGIGADDRRAMTISKLISNISQIQFKRDQYLSLCFPFFLTAALLNSGARQYPRSPPESASSLHSALPSNSIAARSTTTQRQRSQVQGTTRRNLTIDHRRTLTCNFVSPDTSAIAGTKLEATEHDP